MTKKNGRRNGKFKSLLQYHRNRRDLTKSKLASLIGKSATYVRKLENEGYCPPTFKITSQLTEIFELNEEEERQFIKQAFLERLEDDILFFTYLETAPPIANKTEKSNDRYREISSEENNSEKKKETLNSSPKIWEPNSPKQKNYYQATLKSEQDLDSLSSHAKELLGALIRDALEESNHHLYTLEISKHHASFSFSLDDNSDVETLIEEIKSYTSAVLENHLDIFYEQTPSVWIESHELRRLTEPEIRALTEKKEAVFDSNHNDASL